MPFDRGVCCHWLCRIFVRGRSARRERSWQRVTAEATQRPHSPASVRACECARRFRSAQTAIVGSQSADGMARAERGNAYVTPPPLANWSQKHERSTAKRRARQRSHGLSSAAISAFTLAEPQWQLGLRNRRGWRAFESGGDRMGGANRSAFRARNSAERGREHRALSRLLVPPQVRIAGVRAAGNACCCTSGR